MVDPSARVGWLTMGLLMGRAVGGVFPHGEPSNTFHSEHLPMRSIRLFQLGKRILRQQVSEWMLEMLDDLTRLRTSYAVVNGPRSLSDIRNLLI